MSDERIVRQANSSTPEMGYDRITWMVRDGAPIRDVRRRFNPVIVVCSILIIGTAAGVALKLNEPTSASFSERPPAKRLSPLASEISLLLDDAGDWTVNEDETQTRHRNGRVMVEYAYYWIGGPGRVSPRIYVDGECVPNTAFPDKDRDFLDLKIRRTIAPLVKAKVDYRLAGPRRAADEKAKQLAADRMENNGP